MFETVILGAGAAGTGPLVWAARNGALGAWLDRGIAVVDRRDTMGGVIGQYQLNADTAAGTFMECLHGGTEDLPLAALRDEFVTRELADCREQAPPLPLVGRFLRRLGGVLAAELASHPRSRFLGGLSVTGLRGCRDGTLVAQLTSPRGERVAVHAASAVLALGGRQTSWRGMDLQPGVRLDGWQRKILSSDMLIASGGAELARRLLAGREKPLAVVLGGSHSAFSAAWTLLERVPGVSFKAGGVRLLYRTPPRVFYPSRTDALADDCSFSESDVCQATGRVHRLGGLRGDGRQLWRRLRGRGDMPPEHRAVAEPMDALGPAALRSLLDAADIIVPAFGYRLTTVPIHDAEGRFITLARTGPAVDSDARLLTADGTPLPNVFGVGLGSGFRPWGAMSGEELFQGQQNSLWLYQNGLGSLIHTGVRRHGEAFRLPPHMPLRAAG